MNTRSAKAKGKRFENEVRKKLLDFFPNLADNIRVTVGTEKGSDLKLDKTALKEIPYNFECKSRATVAVQTWYEQCISHNMNKVEPVVVFKANRKKPLVALSLEHFLQLITRNNNGKQN